MQALRPAVLALALGLGGCSLPRPFGDPIELQTLLTYGARAVQHDDFDGHEAYQLTLATCDPEHGWGYELGASYGAEDVGHGAARREGEFDELSLGMRRTFGAAGGTVRPYLGLGGALTRLEHGLESPTRGFDDDGGGAYACAGVLWSMGRIAFDPGAEVLVGIDLRALTGQDYDYEQLGVTLGFGK